MSPAPKTKSTVSPRSLEPTQPAETASGNTSIAPPISTASMSQGLERLLRRASTEGWAIASYSRFEGKAAPEAAFIQRLKAGLTQAPRSRSAGQVEWPFDSDDDGLPDLWFYFDNDKVAFIECDRSGTGVHDLRIDLRPKTWETSESKRWLLTPPLPLPEMDQQRLGVADVWDAAIRRSSGGALKAPALEPLVRQQLANFDAEVGRLAAATQAQRADAPLVELERRALALVPQFQKLHRERGYAEKLVKVGSQGHPFDLDGKPGEEVFVFFETTGVSRFRFYERDFNTEKAPVSECALQDGQVVWIKHGGRSFFGTQSHWLRLHADAGRNIARGCFRAGFDAFRARRWYAAVSAWQQGRVLAAVTEDVHSDPQARFGTDFSSRPAEVWSSPSDEFPVERLAGLGLDFVAFRCPSDLNDLAEQLARRGASQEGLKLLEVCLKLTDKCADTRTKVATLESLSTVHQRIGQYDRAIDSLFQSLDLEGSIEFAASMEERVRSLGQTDSGPNLPIGRALAAHAAMVNRAAKLASIAALYFDLGDRDRAETYVTEAERLFAQAEHVYGLADIANLRARLDLTRGNWRLTLSRLQQSLQRQQSHAAAIDEQRRKDAQRDTEGGEARRLNRAEHQQSLRISPEERLVVIMLSPSHPLSYHALTASLLGEACLQGAVELETTSVNEATALRTDAAKWQSQALDWYRAANDPVGESVIRLRQAELAWHNRDYGVLNIYFISNFNVMNVTSNHSIKPNATL